MRVANLYSSRSSVTWKPNTRPSMKGSGSGWRRMIVSLPKYKSKMKTRDYRDIYSGKSSICCA
jgi:hypothetical protein